MSYMLIVNSEKLERIKLKEVAVVNQSTLKGNSNLDKLLYVDISSVSKENFSNNHCAKETGALSARPQNVHRCDLWPECGTL